jgi:L-asparagine transporter-like permease
MSIKLTSLALTYLFAANMVTPNSIWNSLSGNIFGIALIVWAVIALICHGYHSSLNCEGCDEKTLLQMMNRLFVAITINICAVSCGFRMCHNNVFNIVIVYP